MKSLEELYISNKNIRVIGFDDSPFLSTKGLPVKVSGVICSGTRFEGMLIDDIEKDGNNATDVLITMLKNSKFYDQIHLVLIDGIAMGGFNIIDLALLSKSLNRPCMAVMRRQPDMDSIDNALKHFDDYHERTEVIKKAGEIYNHNSFYYQVHGCEPLVAGKVLCKLTDNGNVPEALRLAHIIGSALVKGESGKGA